MINCFIVNVQVINNFNRFLSINVKLFDFANVIAAEVK